MTRIEVIGSARTPLLFAREDVSQTPSAPLSAAGWASGPDVQAAWSAGARSSALASTVPGTVTMSRPVPIYDMTRIDDGQADDLLGAGGKAKDVALGRFLAFTRPTCRSAGWARSRSVLGAR